MLTDPKEIAIISNAKQKNVRDPKRSRQHFIKIFEDFFSDVRLNGRYLDMGPGQYDFCEMARDCGGTCVGLDFDGPVIELGIHKGFETIEANIQNIEKLRIKNEYDGIFNKFALNAFWFHDNPEKHRKFVDALSEMIKPKGWAWLAPWNGVPKKACLSENDVQQTLSLQHEFFENHGFSSCRLSNKQSLIYGIHGTVANNVVYTKNLNWKNDV
jgi:hypothetical protein